MIVILALLAVAGGELDIFEVPVIDCIIRTSFRRYINYSRTIAQNHEEQCWEIFRHPCNAF